MSSEPQRFDYDIFLSHSAKDKPVVRDVAERLRKDHTPASKRQVQVVRDVAERLRKDGLRVWLMNGDLSKQAERRRS